MWHIHSQKQYTLFFSPVQGPLRNPVKYAILLRKKSGRRRAGKRGNHGTFRSSECSLLHKSTFRYRFQREGWTDGKGTLTVWVYENTSFELAKDVESQTFPWTEEGVEQVKAWLEEKLAERGSQPYSIPYPAPKAE